MFNIFVACVEFYYFSLNEMNTVCHLFLFIVLMSNPIFCFAVGGEYGDASMIQIRPSLLLVDLILQSRPTVCILQYLHSQANVSANLRKEEQRS